jgi:hypothetical protein
VASFFHGCWGCTPGATEPFGMTQPPPPPQPLAQAGRRVKKDVCVPLTSSAEFAQWVKSSDKILAGAVSARCPRCVAGVRTG